MEPLQMAIELAEKFVNKVETGKARSKETYQDCLAFLEAAKVQNPVGSDSNALLCYDCDAEMDEGYTRGKSTIVGVYYEGPEICKACMDRRYEFAFAHFEGA